MTDVHRVEARGVEGDLTVLRWYHGGEEAELVKAVDGWVMKLGDALYHLMGPSKEQKSVYSSVEGLQYEAQTVEVEEGGYVITAPDRVVVLDGEGSVVIDGERVRVDENTVCTPAGSFREGDVVNINGRNAKVAIVQQQETRRANSSILSQINASTARKYR